MNAAAVSAGRSHLRSQTDLLSELSSSGCCASAERNCTVATMSAPRVSRPAARYRKGKALFEGAGREFDSDDGDDDGNEGFRNAEQLKAEDDDEGTTDLKGFSSRDPKTRRTAGVVLNLGPGAGIAGQIPSHSVGPVFNGKQQQQQAEAVSEYDSDEYETDTGSESDTKALPSQKGPANATAGSESEYETDSEEDESSSEEEQPQAMLKPMFMSKKQRENAATAMGKAVPIPSTVTVSEVADDESEAKAEAALAARRLEAQQLASDRIKVELLEKAAESAKPDLDDTDGRDPEAEFSAWRVRELQRIKRSWEAEVAKEAEEAERRKREEMTEEERNAVDEAHAAQTRKEAADKRGKMGFMQKYYHKGAFFQDLDILQKRDYATEKTESAVDISTLPKMMQVRDYGKRSRSKYTHLADQDTSRVNKSRSGANGSSSYSSTSGQGGAGGAGGMGQGCFHCGASDHIKRDCPVLSAEKDKERQERRLQYQEQSSRSRHGYEGRDRPEPSRTQYSRDEGWSQRPRPRPPYGDERRGGRDDRYGSRTSDTGRDRSPPSRPPRRPEDYDDDIRSHDRARGSYRDGHDQKQRGQKEEKLDRWAQRQQERLREDRGR